MYNHFGKCGKLAAIFLVLIFKVNFASDMPLEDLTRGPAIDSMFFSEFKAVLYELRAEHIRKALELAVYKDDIQLISEKYEWLTLYNFCFDLNDTTSKCFSKDINSDWADEIIIIGIGERKNAEMAVIYSLADSIKELARFEDISGFHLKDLDGDKIPELIFRDNSFTGMYVEGYGAPRPQIIWQWGEEGYKIANFKFSDYIISEFEKYHPRDSIKSYGQWQCEFGIPYCHDQYLRYLFQYTVTYFFAGQYRIAWDLIKEYVPESFPIRRHSRFDITYNQKYSPYWDDIEESNKLPIDSVKTGDYCIYLMQNHSGNNKPSSMFNDVAIFKGNKKIKYLPYSIHEFGQPQDINKDGIPELIISECTGGANCCFGGYVYSLGDTLGLIWRYEPRIRDFRLMDVDGDSIKELCGYDDTFAHWNETYKFYLPPLIWAWNGNEYRIRNFGLRDYILKDIDMEAIGEMTPTPHLPEYESGFNDVWTDIIFLCYAGMIDTAEFVFDNYWPGDSKEKRERLGQFMLNLKSGPYWQQLLESDW